jgi:hypothetical protein
MFTGTLPQLMALLMMLWLPTKPTGHPAPASTVLRYVPTDATAVITVDIGSVASSALAGFRDLGNQPFVKGVKPVAAAYGQMSKQLNMALRMISSVTGVDPAKDLRYLTLSVVNRRRPEWVTAVGGNLREELVERLAGARKAGPAQRVGHGKLFASSRRGNPSFGWTGDGVLLVGEAALVRSLLQRRPRPGALARLVRPLHDGKTMIAMAARVDKQLERQLRRKLKPPMRAVGQQLASIYLGVRYDGARLALQARRPAMVARYRKVLDGAGSYMAAAELTFHGTLKVTDGVLSPRDRGLPPELAALAKHKRALLGYIHRRLPQPRTSHRVSVNRAARIARLDYRGSRISGVLPLTLLGAAVLDR